MQAYSRISLHPIFINLTLKEIISLYKILNAIQKKGAVTELFVALNNESNSTISGQFTKFLFSIKNIDTAGLAGVFKAGKGFATSLIAAHPVIASIAALAAVGLGLDKFAFNADEKFDEASEALNSYNEVKSEIENINSELETTQNKIDELKAKGTLSLVEEDELSKLEKTNDQLERKLKIKENLQKGQEETAKNALDDYLTNKSDYNNHFKLFDPTTWGNTSQWSINDPIIYNGETAEDGTTFHSVRGVVTEQLTPIQAIESHFRGVEALQNEIVKLEETASQTTDDQQLKKLQNQIRDKTKKLKDDQDWLSTSFSDLSNLTNNFDESSFSSLEDYNQIMSLLDKYDELLGTSGSKTQSKLAGIFEIKELKDLDIQDSLVDYVKNLKDVNEFNFNNIKVDGIDRLKEALNDAGISADDLYQYLKAISDEGTYNIDVISAQLRADLTKVNENTPNDIIQFVNGLSDKELTAVTEIKANSDIDTSQWDIETWRQQIQDYFAENPIDINTELKPVNDEIDAIQSAYSTLSKAVEEYNTNGAYSLDTVQALLALEPQYLAMLVNENGQLSINEQAMRNLVQAQLEEAKSSLYQSAINEINALSTEKTGDASTESANKKASAVEGINAETNALKNNTTAAMMNEAAKNAVSDGVSQDKVNAIVSKYTNMANALDSAIGGLSFDVGGVTSGFDKAGKSSQDTSDKVKDINKQLKDLEKSSALDKLKHKFDSLNKSVEKLDTIISILDNTFDLTGENDYVEKIAITTEQLDYAQQKAVLLADTFSQLKEEEYDNADTAEELASRMKSVADEIGENQPT